MRVLIGEISSYKAIVIARHLRKMYDDVELVAYDNKWFNRRVYTKYVDSCYYVAKTNRETYIKKLAEYVRANEVDVFVPVHSDYIGDILLNKELFGHSLDYLGSYSYYIKFHEKDQLMRIAEDCGVRVPIVYESLDCAQIPFVVKPTDKSSAKGVRYCMKESDRKTIILNYSNCESPIICQEYVVGKGCGYSVYCRDGIILQEYGHLRLAEHPTSGGSSVYRKAFVHPNMRAVAEKLLKRIPWTGFAMFEFKLTPANELVLIEVNPRIWGSINQALSDGVPFFSEVLGKEQSTAPTRYNSELRTCLSPQVFLSFSQYVLKGNVGPLLDYIAHRRSVLKDVSFWNDPKGFVSMVLRKL